MCITGGFTDVAVSDTDLTIVKGILYVTAGFCFVFKLSHYLQCYFINIILSSFTDFFSEESCM